LSCVEAQFGFLACNRFNDGGIADCGFDKRRANRWHDLACVLLRQRSGGGFSARAFRLAGLSDGFGFVVRGWLRFRLCAAKSSAFRTRSGSDATIKLSNYAATALFLHVCMAFRFWIVFGILICAAALVNWRDAAGERVLPRRNLKELPEKLGAWQKIGEDAEFPPEIESVLRTDDYLMRDYFLTGTTRTANIYVGFYNSQKTGATYHSPRNCLPGSGWTMNEPRLVEISLPTSGEKFAANAYAVQNDKEKLLMIYWYQGRGRSVASEYADKLFTVWDSIRLRRSDGALVRVVTPLEHSPVEAERAAIDLSGQLADNLADFVPN
jgi:EpsI family protein